MAAAPNLLGGRDRFCGRHFSCALGGSWFHVLLGSHACVDGVSLVCASQFLAGHRPTLGLGTPVLWDGTCRAKDRVKLGPECKH